MCARRGLHLAASVACLLLAVQGAASGRDAPLPAGVEAVWDLDKACREATPTSERISINGLWRWQPADEAGDDGSRRQLGILQGPGALVFQQPDPLSASGLEEQESERCRRGLVPARRCRFRTAGKDGGSPSMPSTSTPMRPCFSTARSWATCTSHPARSILPPPAGQARSTFCRCASRPCPWPR